MKVRLTARLVHHIKDKLVRFIFHLKRHKHRLFLVLNCADTLLQVKLCGLLLTLNLCSSRLRTCPVVMELFTRTLVIEP